MSFSASSNSQQSEINVTPLIDVLLVLLIIFMIIVPQSPSGLRAVTPQPPLPNRADTPPPATYVLEVQSHPSSLPTYKLNQRPILREQITPRLLEVFATRADRVLFLKGDAALEFRAIAEVISLGHQARIDNIAVLTAASALTQ